MNVNPLKKLMRDNAKTKAAVYAVRGWDELRAALAEQAYKGTDSATRLRFLNEGRLAISRDVYDIMAAERTRIGEEIEKERMRYGKEYEKDVSLHAFRLQNAERRTAAADDKEIAETAMGIGRNGEVDPNEIAIVLRELKTRGMSPEAAALRKNIQENNLDKPWLLTVQGQALLTEHELNMPVVGGGIRMLVDGKQAAFSFDDLAEGDD